MKLVPLAPMFEIISILKTAPNVAQNLQGCIMSDRTEKYLRQQRNAAQGAALQDKWSELEQNYQKKLWHQLTQQIRTSLETGELGNVNTKELYDNFIQDFEHRINTLQLAMICIPIAHNIYKSDPTAAFEFLKKRERVCSKDKTAMIRIQTGVIELKLKNKTDGKLDDPVEIRRLLEQAQNELDNVNGVTEVHAPFYKASAEYLKETRNHAAYYREALRYLGCEDQNKLDDATKLDLAVLLGFAALLGENIFNFGELLAHPVLKSLENSEYNWLLEVLLAFNAGDIPKFKSLSKHWTKWTDLKNAEEAIMNKLRLLCIMEMALQRPSKGRYLSFDDIARQAQVSDKEVEFVVMRALSKNLINGTINQVQKTVCVTWVQPRVLSVEQIKTMRQRIVTWQEDVDAIGKIVEENAKEILTKA
uniref:26S proteasome non-ATPase regulatory subunit 13 n=1 Tax=Steinernema glaseri TaxID=37863 RepID=A0A1I8AVR3_9BILA